MWVAINVHISILLVFLRYSLFEKYENRKKAIVPKTIPKVGFELIKDPNIM
jgi:hypothetical protein